VRALCVSILFLPGLQDFSDNPCKDYNSTLSTWAARHTGGPTLRETGEVLGGLTTHPSASPSSVWSTSPPPKRA
jgi:hypothetical protein